MTFEPFTRITGIAAPLLQESIDTDVIIRVERLTTGDPRALAPFAFEALRHCADGTLDPSFVLNRERFRAASILIAGANFGCGSSREPAVWALAGLGIRCIVAPSFGDIFRSNCVQNGLLPIALDTRSVEALARVAEEGKTVTVDLTAQRISAAGGRWSFQVSNPERQSLLTGLGDLELSLREAPRVAAWEARDRAARPWMWCVDGGER